MPQVAWFWHVFSRWCYVPKIIWLYTNRFWQREDANTNCFKHSCTKLRYGFCTVELPPPLNVDSLLNQNSLKRARLSFSLYFWFMIYVVILPSCSIEAKIAFYCKIIAIYKLLYWLYTEVVICTFFSINFCSSRFKSCQNQNVWYNYVKYTCMKICIIRINYQVVNVASTMRKLQINYENLMFQQLTTRKALFRVLYQNCHVLRPFISISKFESGFH
jgi:hypothetical protein